ncbi:MAG: hypothetical protein KDK36_09205, partial [Leptospiraceae bacterium]|nr:hypothetical protein [Leptospiraceae bacterium]
MNITFNFITIFNIFFIIIIFINCLPKTIPASLSTNAFICIKPIHTQSELPASQKYFHDVILQSGSVKFYSNNRKDDCYYFDDLPIGKVYKPFSATNREVNKAWFHWKNDEMNTPGIYGKFPENTKGKVTEGGKILFLGKYELHIKYSEKNIENYSITKRYPQSISANKALTRAIPVFKNSEYKLIEVK